MKRQLFAPFLSVLSVSLLAILGDVRSAAAHGIFAGAGRLNGSLVSISAQSADPRLPATRLGVVTVDGRSFALSCVAVRKVETRGGPGAVPGEVRFWGQGTAADGKVLLIAARDVGLDDQLAFAVSDRAGNPQASDCEAGRLNPTPIDTGNFVGAEIDLSGIVFPNLPSTAGRFRILTYNTALLHLAADAPPELTGPPCATSCDPLELPPFPVPCGCSHVTIWPNDHRFGNLGDVARALKIAERIIATNQDVVVLNEVFHPGARAAFVQSLAGAGPYDHYISLLRGHPPLEIPTISDLIEKGAGPLGPLLKAITPDLSRFVDFEPIPGDSGLMLFSKYPLLELQGAAIVDDTACGDPECQAEGEAAGGPLQTGFFAFDVYDSCDAADCLASKGVGLVKIATPGNPTYVAFTHMQADYPEDGVLSSDVGAVQFEAIRDLIVGAIPAGEIAGAAIYVAGDLNVAGASRTSPQTAETQEWHDVFDPLSA
ncbi:MAG: endonuclease/exonuclease/phosphatase family protein, partial [Candidatus Binatia bacterium]